MIFKIIESTTQITSKRNVKSVYSTATATATTATTTTATTTTTTATITTTVRGIN